MPPSNSPRVAASPPPLLGGVCRQPCGSFWCSLPRPRFAALPPPFVPCAAFGLNRAAWRASRGFCFRGAAAACLLPPRLFLYVVFAGAVFGRGHGRACPRTPRGGGGCPPPPPASLALLPVLFAGGSSGSSGFLRAGGAPPDSVWLLTRGLPCPLTPAAAAFVYHRGLVRAVAVLGRWPVLRFTRARSGYSAGLGWRSGACSRRLHRPWLALCSWQARALIVRVLVSVGGLSRGSPSRGGFGLRRFPARRF